MSPKNYRQQQLYDRYFFRCQCEACTNNYPLSSVISKSDIPDLLSWKAPGDVSLADVVAYLKQFHRHYPCTQMLLAQVAFIAQILLHYGSVTIDNIDIENYLQMNALHTAGIEFMFNV